MSMILVHDWRVLLLRGLFAVLFGVAALVWPGLTLAVLVLLFGAYALADGLLAAVAALGAPAGYERRWVLLLEGAAGVIVGTLTFLWPAMTALALLYFIAAWAVVTGALQVVAAVRLRELISHEWLLVLGGALSVLFGVALMAVPVAGALAVVWLIGVYAVASGMLLVALALRLRGPGATAEI